MFKCHEILDTPERVYEVVYKQTAKTLRVKYTLKKTDNTFFKPNKDKKSNKFVDCRFVYMHLTYASFPPAHRPSAGHVTSLFPRTCSTSGAEYQNIKCQNFVFKGRRNLVNILLREIEAKSLLFTMTHKGIYKRR